MTRVVMNSIIMYGSLYRTKIRKFMRRYVNFYNFRLYTVYSEAIWGNLVLTHSETPFSICCVFNGRTPLSHLAKNNPFFRIGVVPITPNRCCTTATRYLIKYCISQVNWLWTPVYLVNISVGRFLDFPDIQKHLKIVLFLSLL